MDFYEWSRLETLLAGRHRVCLVVFASDCSEEAMTIRPDQNKYFSPVARDAVECDRTSVESTRSSNVANLQTAMSRVRAVREVVAMIGFSWPVRVHRGNCWCHRRFDCGIDDGWAPLSG